MQVLLEALLKSDRAEVCSRVVGFPRGMQALVDLLDDRYGQAGLGKLASSHRVNCPASIRVEVDDWL